MSFLIDNTPKLLRESYKSNYTNIILDIDNKTIKLLAVKSPINSYNLKILNYTKESKFRLIKIIKVLTNVTISVIQEELDKLPLTINGVHLRDIPKIEMLLDKLEIDYVIT